MNFYLYKNRALFIIILSISLFNISCGPTRPPEQSAGHIDKSKEKQHNIPAAVSQTTLLPQPINEPPLETYTVVVSEVATKDLLFSLARDAKINLDIHDDIKGTITLNAIDQTLPQILERISEQANIRYSIEDNTVRVRADKPYLQTYIVDYVNIARESKGIIRVATNIGSTGQGNIGEGEGGSNEGGENENNSSLTEVLLTSDNKFWQTLSHNIIEIISDTAKIDNNQKINNTQSDKENNNNVIVNREAGLIMVRATYRQHTKIQSYVDLVLNISKRQVLIEATIAEIKLSNRYQAGVDWSVVSGDPTSGLNVLTNFTGNNLVQAPFSSFSLTDTIGGNQISATLKALEQFGDVKVLSSPKIMAINNQPAILKVVDNIVYFEMNINTSINQSQSLTTFQTEIKTVPVGFVMSVTPFVNDYEAVTLNIRPTISRVIDTVEDPNPAFREAGVISEVPIIQIREIESILTINSGDTAVIGGLMQDTVNNNNSGVPFLSSLPIIGSLFKYENDFREKSELIIFIRPVVIHHASLTGDLSDFKQFLPEPVADPKKNTTN